MGPYSHYVLAAKLAPELQPPDAAEYCWGAVAPDIRYLAQMRRDQTHVVIERLQEFQRCYPTLQSFIMGYQVHLLIDQIDVAQKVWAAFPLQLYRGVLHKRIAPQQMTMLVEMAFLQRGGLVVSLSGDHNAVLAGLGISTEQASQYHQGLMEYFTDHSFDSAVHAFQKIGMLENARVEKYLNAYRVLQKKKILFQMLMLGIRNARLDSLATTHVRKNWQRYPSG